MKMGWTIRSAGKEDAATVARLEELAFAGGGWGASAVMDGMSGHSVATLIAEDDRAKAFGFAMWRSLGDASEILTLGVDPAVRRRRAGRALLDGVVRAARSIGARELLLEVDPRNRAAVALYENAGFQRIGRRPRYYRDGGDALLMRLDL